MGKVSERQWSVLRAHAKESRREAEAACECAEKARAHAASALAAASFVSDCLEVIDGLADTA